MIIDKDFWLNLHLREDKSSEITCPACGKGKINISEHLMRFETEKSKKYTKYVSCFGGFIDKRFSGFLICNNDECNEIVAVCGSVNAEQSKHNDTEYINQDYIECLLPEYFSPPLNIFPLKQIYPSAVNKLLEKSFSLFFMDNESCGNKIRISVEVLLDELGVRKEKDCKHKTYRLNLNDRIREYQSINMYIGELMLSIKWIGNYGSHNDSISKSDLLDGYEMMCTILDNLYDNQTDKLLKLSRTINIHERPASKITN